MKYTDIVLSMAASQGTVLPREVLAANPILNKAALTRAFRKLYNDGQIKTTKFGFKLTAKYRQYRHAKRLVDTHSKNPQNRYDRVNMNCELTCEGLAPLQFFGNESVIDDLVNPLLVKASLIELSKNGIQLVGDTEIGGAFGYNDWTVTGSEWMDRTANVWDPRWEVEIMWLNNSGVTYYFHTSFRVNVRDFV